MELARLASKQQAASKPLAPEGPFRALEQQGSQNRKNMLSRYPGWCWDHKQSPLGPGRPVSRPPKCSMSPSGCARGGQQVGPKRAQKYQNAPVPPWGAPEGSVVQVDGQNQLGCLLAVFGPMWPRNRARWARNGFICRLKLENGRISG